MSPFFSIIIPTYNRAKYLVTALESVNKQTYHDYEVIVVDDGSIDQTYEVVAEMIKINPRIKYFYKKNEERSIARNYGINLATGRYISFLDSDDIMYANHLAVAFDLLDGSNREVGHLGFEHVDSLGNVFLRRNDFSNFREKLIYENVAHGNAIFIRRDVASDVQFIPDRDATISEDWYVWLRLAARYNFAFDPTVTCAVVEHEDRSLRRIEVKKLLASTHLIVQYLKADKVFVSVYRRAVGKNFARHYTLLTLVMATSGQPWQSTIKFLWLAARYDPAIIVSRRFLAAVKNLLRRLL